MYIINDTYFQSPKREIPNLDETDSKTFEELERLIDEHCRLFLYYFLTPDEVTEFDSYLDEDGLFPENTTGIPQRWINLVNGTTYTSNDVDLVWGGLIQERGTSCNSLLADFVYHNWLETQASYMSGVGDSKGNPKGANLVNPTQRIVTVWNEFVKQYQSTMTYEVSLLRFLSDNQTDYTSDCRRLFEVKNQLGL